MMMRLHKNSLANQKHALLMQAYDLSTRDSCYRETNLGTILGPSVTEGRALGAPMSTLEALYSICKAIQWHTTEA
jgi:hypothetical protein